MATEQIGPDPPGRPSAAQPGWPKGIVDLARHPSRVYSLWVNGNEQFYFRAVPRDIAELLALFGEVRIRDQEIRLVAGTGRVSSFNHQEFEYNVALQVVTGIALAYTEDQSEKGKSGDLPLEPRLTIYCGEDDALLRQLHWPVNAIIDCRVPGAEVQSPHFRPHRSSNYGQLEFADGSPAEGFVRNVVTRITLWEQGIETGISVAEANNQGRFVVRLSTQEMADLEAGKTWLTVTIGNWLTDPRPSDRRFPVELLAPSRDQTRPLAVGGAHCYYGRLLFEDGGPPVLKPEPWPGAQIMIDFPYAGSCEPDAEGYFQVVLTPQQFEELQRRKPYRNVYIPSYTEQGTSTARFVYPPELLAETKPKAGLLKIPRPLPPETPADATGPASLEAEAHWGEAVEGVQARLWAKQTSWRRGATPRLFADVRNQGARHLLVRPSKNGFTLQVDGQWFQRQPSTREVRARPSPLPPGREYKAIVIDLDAYWVLPRQSRDPASLDRMARLKDVLLPGKHTVRVAVMAMADKSEPGKPVRAISNPVQIEILPAQQTGSPSR